jgi:hypothetical protein
MSGPVSDFGPDWLVKRIQDEWGKDCMLTPPFGVPYQKKTYYVTVHPDTNQARVDHESQRVIPDDVRQRVFERAMDLEGWMIFLINHIDMDETAIVGEWNAIADALNVLDKSPDLTTAQREGLASLVMEARALAEQDPTEKVGEVIREQEALVGGLVGNQANEKDYRSLFEGYQRVIDQLESHRRKAESFIEASQTWLKEAKAAFPARHWLTALRYHRCVKEMESCRRLIASTRQELLDEPPYTLVEPTQTKK